MFFARFIRSTYVYIWLQLKWKSRKFNSSVVSTMRLPHSIPFHCTAFRFFDRNFKCTETLHSNTLFLFEHFPFSSALCQFAFWVKRFKRFHLQSKRHMLLGKKMPLFKSKRKRKWNGEKQKKEEAFMKGTLTDVNKIKSLWIRFFCFCLRNCRFRNVCIW